MDLYKGEIAFYHGQDRADPDGDLHRNFVIAGTELWDRFANDLVIVAQYLFNGTGAVAPKSYIANQNSAVVQEGLSFLLGQHYLLLSPSWEVHPLVNRSGRRRHFPDFLFLKLSLHAAGKMLKFTLLLCLAYRWWFF